MSDEASAAGLIWCPFPDAAAARQAANALLDDRLIACANLIPDMQSLFVWRGEREEAREVGALFKTSAALLDRAMQRLKALHPYEAPAITGWTVRAENATLQWLLGETRGA